MSAIIHKTKQNYRYYLTVELALIVVGTVGVSAFFGYDAFSFLGGALASFLPHCLFVFWVFFRKKSALYANKLTSLYQGEALKWLLTILLIVAAFTLYATIHIALFASGYFLMLVCNSLLPLCLKR